MAYPVTDLAAYFTGRWGLHREITEESGGELGTFVGSAEFRPEDSVLVYHEQGVLRLGEHRGRAYRTLRYQLGESGRARVYFDYGDFFHDLDLRDGHWSARHPCRDDLYEGEFEVCGPHRWRQRWLVAGPRKNHVLSTVFDRVH